MNLCTWEYLLLDIIAAGAVIAICLTLILLIVFVAGMYFDWKRCP